MSESKSVAVIFEDNPIDQKILSRLLERLGFEVFMTDDEVRLLGIAGKNEVSIYFVDLNVSAKGDGFTAIEAIKSNQPQSLIFVTSSENDLNLVRKALKLGVDDYVIKPFDYQDLSIRLTRYFRQALSTASKLSVLPSPNRFERGEISFQVEVSRIDEDSILFQSHHLFLKETTLKIESPLLDSVFGAKGPHAVSVVDTNLTDDRSVYWVIVKPINLDPAQIPKIRRNILKLSSLL